MARNPYDLIVPLGMPGETPMQRENKGRETKKTYVRYKEGAEMYSMSRHTFMHLAAEAGAVRKINRLSLVNTKVFEEYIETFAV